MSSEIAMSRPCECGCGQPAPIATKTNRRRGHVKGQPVRFVSGHNDHRPLTERFWEKVDRSGGPDSCWLWTGRRLPKGYGQIGFEGRPVYAHRVSWELHFGPIPLETPCVCHNCPGGDNPSCVNPAHLFLDTKAGNNEDRDRKGRHRYGVLRGEQNGHAKLTELHILDIRRLNSEDGLSPSVIAGRFGVHSAYISAILAGRAWAHLKEAS